MKSESITKKILLSGKLRLLSPLLIGSGHGSDDASRDIEILRNADGQPLSPGTSLAGVLRAYSMRENPAAAELLFGTQKTKAGAYDYGLQSAIFLDDVILTDHVSIEQRDGVSIDAWTGTAIEHHRYDYEAVASGACGSFSAEITLRGLHEAHAEEIDALLAALYHHLASGFHLGAGTAKGLGRVRIENLSILPYDFSEKEDVQRYLRVDRQLPLHPEVLAPLEAAAPAARDFEVDAWFAIRSSLIVRDYDVPKEEQPQEDAPTGEDAPTIVAVMKRVRKGNDADYLIPGSSLKGVLRHHAQKLLASLQLGIEPLEAIMGPDTQRLEQKCAEKRKSFFYVEEATLKDGVEDAKQTRNRIDRFTNGTIDGSLFTTKPIWQMELGNPVLHLRFGVENAAAHPERAGLVLLLLKDLWLGRIAIGGEVGIGRGTVDGVSATIYDHGTPVTLQRNEDGSITPVSKDVAARWQGYVDALCRKEETTAETEGIKEGLA